MIESAVQVRNQVKLIARGQSVPRYFQNAKKLTENTIYTAIKCHDVKHPEDHHRNIECKQRIFRH